jgi:hypothetical protein
MIPIAVNQRVELLGVMGLKHSQLRVLRDLFAEQGGLAS